MFKSLILSALLSFGTASYEFDCSEILQTRSAPVESIDYSRVLSFTIDNTDSQADVLIDRDNLNFVEIESTINISGFVNTSYFYTRINGYDVDEGTEGMHNLEFRYYSEYDRLNINFSSNDVMAEIYLYSNSSPDSLNSIYFVHGYSIEFSEQTQINGYEGAEVYLTLTQVQELAQIFSYYITSYELEPVPTLSLIEEIGQVLMWVPGQFVTLFSTLTAVFYVDGALTLPGLFLVIGLGVFICALILDFILKFRRI